MATIPGAQFILAADKTVNAVETRTGTGVKGAIGGDFNVEIFVGLEPLAPKAPGFDGLDQINCTIPSGVASSVSAPVVITSGNRISNTATLAIE